MSSIEELLKKNKRWSSKMHEKDPSFFLRLTKQEAVKYLWIGCSDSRVPANELLGLLPGTVFVHRNIANLVIHTDINCMSVIEYAVKILKVEHIILTGHYDCGGIKAAMEMQSFGLIDGWLRSIKDLYIQHIDKFHCGMTKKQRIDKLTELNVIEQTKNICHATCVQEAWKKGQPLSVNSLIYSVENGQLKTLISDFNNADSINDLYHIT